MKLYFYALRLYHCQIFFVTYSLVLMHIAWSWLFGCLWVLQQLYFSNFALFVPCTAFTINLYSNFPSLSPFLSTSTFFLFNSTYGFSHCDWLNSNTRCIILALILALNKVPWFQNKSHTFLYQKVWAPIF